MKYFALTSIAASLVIAFVGCKTMNHQTTSASIIQPDSVRYLGASDSLPQKRDPREAERKRQKEESDRQMFEGAVGIINDGLDHYAQEQGEATGFEYVGKGIYNFFAYIRVGKISRTYLNSLRTEGEKFQNIPERMYSAHSDNRNFKNV